MQNGRINEDDARNDGEAIVNQKDIIKKVRQ
jgi:hypothetical protein